MGGVFIDFCNSFFGIAQIFLKTDSLLLVYDDSCSLCCRFAALAMSWDISGRLERVGISDPRLQNLVPHVSKKTLKKSFHLISADGTISSEAQAIPQLFRLFPAGRPVAWLLENLPGSRWILRGMLKVIGDMKLK